MDADSSNIDAVDPSHTYTDVNKLIRKQQQDLTLQSARQEADGEAPAMSTRMESCTDIVPTSYRTMFCSLPIGMFGTEALAFRRSTSCLGGM